MHHSLRRFLTIVLGATGLACLLGIAVDLVTAHVAVEYFTVHHPHIVDSESPWVMALVWGIGASWWFGAVAGLIVATINHRRQEPIEPGRILKWSAISCVILWMVMMGILVGVLALANTIPVEIRRPTFDFDRRIMAVAMAHQFEYLLGAIALAIVAIITWRSGLQSRSIKKS
ncbi:MAG: hypothetical protein U0795_05405 [Pirellulales bacterium]